MNTPFDQYQRYKTTEIIVNAFKKYHKLDSIKLIEVGANEHKNLEKFLNKDDIYYLDINLPQHLIDDPKYILGDATNLENIKDNEYDIAVALDVYEHIPSKKRADFLKELGRISKYGVMLCAPFDYPHVLQSEIRANEYFKFLTGEDFIWLKEHIDEKLPNLEFTNKIIEDMDQSYMNFEHGEIGLWEKLIKCHFYASRSNETMEYRKLIDKLYNSELFKSDIGKENYRTFIVYSNYIQSTDFIQSEINKFFIKEEKHKDLKLIDELAKDLVEINKITKINEVNKNTSIKEKIYELVYYFKDLEKNEYREDRSIKKTLSSKIILDKISFSKCDYMDEIRIDPISSNCIISISDIYTIKDSKRTDLKIKSTNCDIKYDNKYFFSIEDPQIYIDLNNIDIDNIFLNYKLIDYDNESINETISLLSKIINEKHDIKKDLESKLVEKEDNVKMLENKLLEKEIYIQNIENSRSWILINKMKKYLKRKY